MAGVTFAWQRLLSRNSLARAALRTDAAQSRCAEPRHLSHHRDDAGSHMPSTTEIGTYDTDFAFHQ